MTEKAFELHAELGNATSEVSSLLADIDHKSKVEDRNRVLIPNFRTQLDQQLEVLHETVAACNRTRAATESNRRRHTIVCIYKGHGY
ncbi:hypothetical protein ACSBR2_022286 [Camellia fascicularis]